MNARVDGSASPVIGDGERVLWHELECGSYTADLALWRELAARHDGPILDIGAGTGRVTLDLVGRGHEVVALDHDPALLAELGRRAGERALSVPTVCADARAFAVAARFALCLVPMQTIQLLGGPDGRARFLACARAHLRPGGLLAAAIVEQVECYEEQEGAPGPLPDVLERDGTVYFSQPTAVRRRPEAFVLERRRERVGPRGEREVHADVIRLDRVSAARLTGEGRSAGLRAAGTRWIDATDEHVGGRVVMLGA